MSKRLDLFLIKNLLFFYVVSGCDIILWFFGIGKVGVLKKYVFLENLVFIFMLLIFLKFDIEKEGEWVLFIMYGCVIVLSLLFVWFDRF